MLLAPQPIAARSGGTEAIASRPSSALSTPVADAGHTNGEHQPPQGRSGVQPVGEQLADRDDDQEQRDRTRPLERVRDPAHSSEVTTPVPAQATTGRLADHRPAPVADLHQRRGERRHADHPGAEHE